jgi:tRNA/tmRNA/rRNA uracil-C5-methylase (TrmA/RlmC/RlmD family)
VPYNSTSLDHAIDILQNRHYCRKLDKIAKNSNSFSGRAEHLLPNMLKQNSENVRQVAIVDPPRAGLHNKAVYALRYRLVVSCDHLIFENIF